MHIFHSSDREFGGISEAEQLCTAPGGSGLRTDDTSLHGLNYV